MTVALANPTAFYDALVAAGLPGPEDFSVALAPQLVDAAAYAEIAPSSALSTA